MEIHPEIRRRLQTPPRISNAKLLLFWKNRSRQYCKPCWELKYCPYGPLVEDFPLLPLLRAEEEKHISYYKECLRTGRFPSGEKLDAKRKVYFQAEVKKFNKKIHPERIPKPIAEAACRVFGHICPVYFVGEPLTETKSMRAQSRSIPREVMLKVVRRDGQICQRCFEPVPDDQVEFDHVIPFSKGGTTTSDNLKLCCRTCNRKKSNSLSDILSPNPIEHLFTLRKKKS